MSRCSWCLRSWRQVLAILSARTTRVRQVPMPMRLGWSRKCCARRGTTGSRSARGPARSSIAPWTGPATRPGRLPPGSTAGSADPLPAERHAARIAAGAAEVLIFTSLSVPAASWRQWAREAARSGAPLVLRGVAGDGLRATVKRIGERLGGAKAGVAIDPPLFRLFGVERVPAVVVVPPCRSRGCTDDPAPPHDRVTGNIGLAAALEAVAGRRRGRPRHRPASSATAERGRAAMTERSDVSRDRIEIALDRHVRAGLPGAVGGLRDGGKGRPRIGVRRR